MKHPKKRTTRFYFNKFGIKIVIWRKQHRPIKQYQRIFCTEEQINSARRRLIDREENINSV